MIKMLQTHGKAASGFAFGERFDRKPVTRVSVEHADRIGFLQGLSLSAKASLSHPKALLRSCEVCGAPNAAFGVTENGKTLSYCGWSAEGPVCVGKGQRRQGPAAT